MKYWPATDPRSNHYPGDLRKFNEAAGRRHQIQLLRELAANSSDPDEARRLYKAADDLAQRPLPLKIIRKKDLQLSLFASDPETSSWSPSGDHGHSRDPQ